MLRGRLPRGARTNSRERVRFALEYKEPDRVPFDLGGTAVTGIQTHAYRRLREGSLLWVSLSYGWFLRLRVVYGIIVLLATMSSVRFYSFHPKVPLQQAIWRCQMSEDVQRKLNFVRYGLVVVTLVVLVITLAVLAPFASSGLMGWGEVAWRTLLYTAIAAVVCAVVYYIYRSVVAKG